MIVSSFAELEIDRRVAPGWSRGECVARRAFLVRVNEDTAWVAAMNPLDITVVDDFAWLCNRRRVEVIEITADVLTEALRQLYGVQPQSE
jgi:hypothetical protein